jgi:exodeoxyribonuclease V beta subunit
LTRDADESSRYNQEVRRQRSIDDSDGDELRLLYVALTRAKHHVTVWWASVQGSTTSALGRVLLDRFGAGAVQNSPTSYSRKQRGSGPKIERPTYQESGPAQAAQQIGMLVQHSDARLGLTTLAEVVPASFWKGRVAAPTDQLEVAASNRREHTIDRTWARWSFSRLGTMAESIALGDGIEPAVDVGERALDVGGVDEPAEPADEFMMRDDEPDEAGQMQFGLGPVAHLADVAGGTRFGTFVHSVLEHLDFTSPTLESDLRIAAVEQARRDGLEVPLDDVVAGLAAAVRTPLGHLFAGRALADIPPHDRLPELTFDFPISGRFAAGAIGDAMLATLHPSDRLRPFATQLSREFRGLDISGWMHGSIDAVFRVTDPDDEVGPRYLIVDYKTNRVHQPGTPDPVAAYHPARLVPAMEHSRYPLQALLYSVALHRYLRWRLGDAYVPHDHLGGVGYLFVRGMVGPTTPMVRGVPHGVFSWRPPTTTILEIDRLFSGGVS